MKILIDAWLERKDPLIRFIDGDTSSVLLQVGPALTRHLFEHGEISIEDLQDTRDHMLTNMIYRLLGMPVTTKAF